MVLPGRAQVPDRLIPCDRRRLVHPVRERRRARPCEQVAGGRIEHADGVIRRRRDVGVEVVPDVAQVVRRKRVDVVLRTEQSQLLAAEPDEAKLVQRRDVLHLLGDVEDRRGAGRIVEHSGAVDRVEVGVDDDDVVLVSALRVRDDVPIGPVEIDDRVDADARHRQGRSGLHRLLVLVEEALPDGKRRERDRDRPDEGVPCSIGEAADQQVCAAGIPLVEDDHPRCARCLRVQHLHAEVATAALDQGDPAGHEAGEVARGAPAGRGRRRRRRQHDAARRLDRCCRGPAALTCAPIAQETVGLSSR